LRDILGDLMIAEVKEWIESRTVAYTTVRELGLLD
jgi:hypothetical protein